MSATATGSARPHGKSPYLYPLEMMQAALVAAVSRQPSGPECSVTIGTTAKHGSAADPEPKRLHTWEIVVRGQNPIECDKLARRLDDGLEARYGHELQDDSIADRLAASVEP